MTGLTKDLQLLDDFLLSEAVHEDAMLLSELDGYLAGIIVCPEMILLSEWLPLIWGEEEPVYDDLEQAEKVTGILMKHYNTIISQLNRNRYQPIYDVDIDNVVLWETWIEGFWQATRLRPTAWKDFAMAHGDNEDVQRALFILGRLAQFTIPGEAEVPKDFDAELEDAAADLIPLHVQILHHARLDWKDAPSPFSKTSARKVGRNDPCPCGSGKKFKKCCMN
ncbi:UPF0149 family protein [Rhodospirillum sp. A1_3_36]|uniref:UPF0149 family protein n=1 Tax=Rhodospirillum sp. A1_3_36 TaxID=3391666 RepID=UPI0039A52B53